jgi:hypothetical protein
MRNHIKSLTLLLAVCVVTMSAGTAFAQTGVDGYRGGAEQVQGNVQAGLDDEGGPGAPTTVSGGAEGGGALPFTGLDVALILAVGGVLLAVGVGTRRLMRQADAA